MLITVKTLKYNVMSIEPWQTTRMQLLLSVGTKTHHLSNDACLRDKTYGTKTL